MFNKKEETNSFNSSEWVYESIKEKDIVECFGCKSLLFKKSVIPVKHCSFICRDLYYCEKCRPNYDEAYIVDGAFSVCGYNTTTYLKNRVEVDKKGKPINTK